MSVAILRVPEEVKAGFSALVKRTNKANPSEKDLRALRKIFAELPNLVSDIGNLQRNLQNSIVESATSNSAFGREAMNQHLETMRTNLGYYTSSFVEQMLIDEVVMRWLRLQIMEHDHKERTYAEHTLALGMYEDKRLHLAQARYLRAIETLAKVRKMIAITQSKGAEMFKNLMEGKKAKDEEAE